MTEPSFPHRPFVPDPETRLDRAVEAVTRWGLIVSGVGLCAFGLDAVITALFFK